MTVPELNTAQAVPGIIIYSRASKTTGTAVVFHPTRMRKLGLISSLVIKRVDDDLLARLAPVVLRQVGSGI